jgi:outer membrane protein
MGCLPLAALLCVAPCLGAQSTTSASPAAPWQPPVKLHLEEAQPPAPDRGAPPAEEPRIDPAHHYTLAELVDLAEQHNPETRAAWQLARVRAAQVGIARSALLPTLTGLVLGQTERNGVLFNSTFVRQTLGVGELALELDYTVFDFGARALALRATRSDLFAQDFAFNNQHLQVLYGVTDAYYRLLDAQGQVEAANINLHNAQTVQENADARLAQGLATLPDALEARAAFAQATYDLASLQGAEATARGALLTILGARVSVPLAVQSMDELAPPKIDEEAADQAIDRALLQRPDLQEQVARIRAADDRIQQARTAYAPHVNFSGTVGRVRAFGEQDLLPSAFAGTGVWNAQLGLTWDLFDGGRRESELAAAHAERREAAATLQTERDQAADQVWTAYQALKTAVTQQRAAESVLLAANTSFAASTEAYREGVRTEIDVVSSQRQLAQARSQEVSARANLYRQTAALAFRTGDLLRQGPAGSPVLHPAAAVPAPSSGPPPPPPEPIPQPAGPPGAPVPPAAAAEATGQLPSAPDVKESQQ